MEQISITCELCTFCYKRVPDDYQHQKSNLDKFFTLLKRFVCESQPISLFPSSLGYCKDCEYLVSDFCNVYHEMKCFELQLHSKLKTLENVMNMADRVPSRVKFAKQYFEQSDLSKEQRHQANEKETINMDNHTKLTNFTSTRTELLETCHKGQNLSARLPRVLLQKLDESRLVIKSFKSSVAISPAPTSSVTDDFEAKVTLNLCQADKENEQPSDKSFQTLDARNETLGSADLLTLSESDIEEEDMSTVKHEILENVDQEIINGTTNPIEIQVSLTDSPPNKNKISKSKREKSFSCPHCPRKCTQEKYLKSHIWSRHRTIKRNIRKFQKTRKNVGKFRCGLCNIFCTTYQVLKTHKYSAPHRFLLKRSSNTKFVKREQASEQFKSHFKKPTTQCHKIETECQNISQQATSDENDKDSSYSRNSDSTDTNDSSEDSYSSSSHDENEQEVRKSSKEKYFYCRKDECKSKVNIFRRKLLFEEHKKLHKRGEYKCNFCAKVESTAIKLSLHECEMHSSIPSSSTNTKQNEEVYNCARCPFECKIEASYFKHFASVHLGIYNAMLERNFFKCEICKKKLLNRNHIAKLHFTSHHDTTGLKDPDSQIKRCDENECTAYFLSTNQLNLHQETQHFSSQPCVDEDCLEIDDVTEDDQLKCKFCEKIFPSLKFLLKHKRKFHSKRKTDTFLTNQTEFSEKIRKYKRLVCPELSCAKSFPSKIGLETHKKLHGTFPCNFCDHVDSFALDLALHEKEMHSSTLLNKRSAKPKLKLFKCSRCPKMFLYQNRYKTHFVNTHLNLDLTFGTCSICKYAANSESELRTHIYRYHYTKDMDLSKISKCDLCPAYFKIESQLIHHKTNAHNANESPLQCKECANVFRSEAGLKLHVLQTHKSKSNKEFQTMYNCVLDKCKRKFPNKQSLGRHQKLHGKGEFPCHFCDEICETVLKLISHETTNHLSKTTEKNMFSCSRCSYKNKFAGRFENHFAETHTKSLEPITEEDKQMPGKFKCKICKIEFNYGSDLAVHEAQHNQNSGYYFTCPRCPSVVKKLSYVAHFLRKHLGNSKRKMCSICKEQVVRMATHYKTCHKTDNLETDTQIYKCDGEDGICQAYFIKAEQLIRHKRKIHVLEWKCKDCGKILKSRISLKFHTDRFHPFSDENPHLQFKCDIKKCKKRFGTIAELDCHQSNHNKSPTSFSGFVSSKFKCEKCDKEFATKNSLQGHINNAHSERSFICPECGKMFKLKGGLDTHLLYHTGPSSWKFQCSTCGKKCVTKNSLASHMNTHSKERSWVCQFCGNKYAHQHNWKNHLLAKHGDEDNVPNKMKVSKRNRLSRKGTKKGDCILAGI